jgi:hypothetical protein
MRLPSEGRLRRRAAPGYVKVGGHVIAANVTIHAVRKNLVGHMHTSTAETISAGLHIPATIAAQRPIPCSNGNDGVRMRMSYCLAAAAAATGLDKTTILRAIREGKIAGTKDELGEWQVEPAALHLLYPPVAEHPAESEAGQRSEVADVEALGAQIEALLRQAGRRLRQQADALHRDRDAEDDRAQAEQLAFADQDERLR